MDLALDVRVAETDDHDAIAGHRSLGWVCIGAEHRILRGREINGGIRV
jgi:hypothetical protein